MQAARFWNVFGFNRYRFATKEGLLHCSQFLQQTKVSVHSNKIHVSALSTRMVIWLTCSLLLLTRNLGKQRQRWCVKCYKDSKGRSWVTWLPSSTCICMKAWSHYCIKLALWVTVNPQINAFPQISFSFE